MGITPVRTRRHLWASLEVSSRVLCVQRYSGQFMFIWMMLRLCRIGRLMVLDDRFLKEMQY